MYEWLDEDEIYWIVERISDMISTIFFNYSLVLAKS